MRHLRNPRGFTMTEILIVIAIIVLVLALAVPALNFIGGSKSVEGATNSISAVLAKARNLAIGHQQVYGVFFYLDPASTFTTLAIVRDVGSSNTFGGTTPEAFLDLDPVNNDVLALPSGVSAQMVDDGFANGNTAQPSDRYIGYNTAMHDAVPMPVTSPLNYGGVILFDADGRVVRKIYTFQISTGSAPGPYAWTLMGKLFEPSAFIVAHPTPTTAEQDWSPGPTGTTVPERSSVGLVLFDHSAFINTGGTDTDPQVINGNSGSYTAGSEPAEEAWLDQNAALLLINRYNGTIVKSE